MKLLADLSLARPADWEAYWRQAKWPKPNLVELGRNLTGTRQQCREGQVSYVPPIRYALNRLDANFVAAASEQVDPFGWLLEHQDVVEWSKACRDHRAPWMSRVWLASASQLLAERHLVFKAHGLSDTWDKLKQNPRDNRLREDYYCAQLRHAKGQRKTDLLGIRMPGLSEASSRRLRRAKGGEGKRAGVSKAEKFMVQHWIELPLGGPGLCFFSDSALESLMEVLDLSTGEGAATKQVRARLGLIQAGVARHFVDDVVAIDGTLAFKGNDHSDRFSITGTLSWGTHRLWPRR